MIDHREDGDTDDTDDTDDNDDRDRDECIDTFLTTGCCLVWFLTAGEAKGRWTCLAI